MTITATAPVAASDPTSDAVALSAEATLTLLTAVTCVGFIRAFTDWEFLPRLLVAGVASHLVAALARRLKRGMLVGFAASCVAGAFVLAHVLYGATTKYLLPTGRTIDLLVADLRDAAKTFPTAVPPVDGTAGYLAAAAIAVWVAAFLADSFAFRAKATAEAVVPLGILFVFISAVAADRSRITHAMAWLGAALAFAVTHRAYRRLDAGGWLSGHRKGAATALLRSGGLLAVAATLAAVVIGPHLPGARSQALVDTKRSGPDTLYVLSPLVDIKKRVASRSTVDLFTVNTATRTYLRATALPDFDGRQWTSDLNQGDANDTLRPTTGDRITAEITIAALADVWMPVPYQPVGLVASTMKNTPKWDQETSTLLVPGSLRKGDKYIVASVLPQFDIATARRLSQLAPRSISNRYLELPSDYPLGMRSLAQDITRSAPTRFEKARALQDWFRTEFTYDLSAKSGQSTNDIQGFIESKRGYCEQFSGTFAAMARSLGIPARVAVGFTAGEQTSPGVFTVKAKHAHAWPEIYVERLGWIAFEPTPGRGNASTTYYTGAASAQADEPAGDASNEPTTTVAQTAFPSIPNIDNLPDLPGGVSVDGGTEPIYTGGGSKTALWWLLGLVGAVGLGFGYPAAVKRLVSRRWARRRRHAGSGGARVLVAWNRLRFNLARAGVRPKPSETPMEFADRVGASTAVDRRSVIRLAELVTASTFGNVDPEEAELTSAEQVPNRAAADLLMATDRRGRLLLKLDPRPVFTRLPGDEGDDRFDVREN